ncbi:hypothetical protein QOT17_011136 [Balamuthia mandrillaris]
MKRLRGKGRGGAFRRFDLFVVMLAALVLVEGSCGEPRRDSPGSSNAMSFTFASQQNVPSAWECSDSQQDFLECKVCFPYRLTQRTKHLFELVDFSELQVDLGTFLMGLSSFNITVPASKLGSVGALTGDLDVPVTIDEITFDQKAKVDHLLMNLNDDRTLLYHHMLSNDGVICASLRLRPCEETVQLTLTNGNEPFADITFHLGAFIGCANKKQILDSGRLEMDYMERSLSFCTQILKGRVLPHDLCFKFDDVVWTASGISLCPTINLKTPFNRDTLAYSCFSLGSVSECGAVRTELACNQKAGCGWCASSRTCMSSSLPPSPCEGCASWDYRAMPEQREAEEVTPSSNDRHTISFLHELRKTDRNQADSIEVRFCGDWSKYTNTERGTIDQDGWVNLMNIWIPTPENLENAFYRLDRNEDSEISYTEYCTTASLIAAEVSYRYGGLLEGSEGDDDLEDGVMIGIIIGSIGACVLACGVVAFVVYMATRSRRKVEMKSRLSAMVISVPKAKDRSKTNKEKPSNHVNLKNRTEATKATDGTPEEGEETDVSVTGEADPGGPWKVGAVKVLPPFLL